VITCATVGGSFALSKDDTSIKVVGKVNNSLNLSLDDLKAMNTTSVTVIPDPENEKSLPETYKGVLLKDILDRAEVTGGHRDTIHYVILAKATDGYTATIAYGEIRENDDGNKIILAFEKDGKAIRKDEGGPVRLIVPTDDFQGRWVKWVREIDVNDTV